MDAVGDKAAVPSIGFAPNHDVLNHFKSPVQNWMKVFTACNMGLIRPRFLPAIRRIIRRSLSR